MPRVNVPLTAELVIAVSADRSLGLMGIVLEDRGPDKLTADERVSALRKALLLALHQAEVEAGNAD